MGLFCVINRKYAFIPCLNAFYPSRTVYLVNRKKHSAAPFLAQPHTTKKEVETRLPYPFTRKTATRLHL